MRLISSNLQSLFAHNVPQDFAQKRVKPLARRGASLGVAGLLFVSAFLGSPAAHAQNNPDAEQTTGTASPAPDENVLGELLITSDGEVQLTPLAILPSLSPAIEDVIVRTVIRRDFELTGMFEVLPDSKAPPGMYGFNDPVDITAWSARGAEVIIKVAAQKQTDGRIRIAGLCYFLDYGQQPVYEKTIVVKASEVRATAHEITDALLGAITGRKGGFASHLTFAARRGRNYSIYSVDADGHGIIALTAVSDTSIAPLWGPQGLLFYARSRKYSPFRLIQHQGRVRWKLPFRKSVYSAAFSKDFQRLAVAVARPMGSAIYVGNANGSDMQKVSNTEVATHPVFSTEGKLAWVGGTSSRGPRRIYIDGKAVSPRSFSAAAPEFCDTEEGVRLIYAVAVGRGQDLIMADGSGGNIARLTQSEGSNSYPACSPDGRMLAYFSERKGKGQSGVYIKSLKNWESHRISGRVGESLRWAALPSH